MTAIAVPEQRSAPQGEAAVVWALVEQAQAGDTAAIGELYRRYQPMLLRYLFFRLGHRHLAEDLAHDVWARALSRLNTVQWQGVDIGAWLMTIARNRAADHFKSGRYRSEYLTGEVLDVDAIERSPGPELTSLIGEVSTVIRTALDRLGEEQRRVLELRFLAGLNVAETAAVMGKNEGAIKALQLRATRAMARQPGVLALAGVS